MSRREAWESVRTKIREREGSVATSPPSDPSPDDARGRGLKGLPSGNEGQGAQGVKEALTERRDLCTSGNAEFVKARCTAAGSIHSSAETVSLTCMKPRDASNALPLCNENEIYTRESSSSGYGGEKVTLSSCNGRSAVCDSARNHRDVANDGFHGVGSAVNGSTIATLQVELAGEKKKNIAAEQRILELEKEIKVLRAENMRLASSISGDVTERSRVRSNMPAAAERVGESASQGGMEQIVVELQEELELSKQYTKVLETRLGEKSSALERCSRDLDVKEGRIRQLERTIADELIRRTKADAGNSGSAAELPKEIGENTHNKTSSVLTPSVVQRVSSVVRTHQDRESVKRNHSDDLGVELTRGTSNAIPCEINQVSGKQQRRSITTIRGPSVIASSARDGSQQRASSVPHNHHPASARAALVQQKKQQKDHVGAEAFPVSSTPRHATVRTRRLLPSTVAPPANERRKDSIASSALMSTSSSSFCSPKSTARKPVTKPVKSHERRSKTSIKRESRSPAPNSVLLESSLRDELTLPQSATSRRSVNRPPPLESSPSLMTFLGSNTTMLQQGPQLQNHNETRSVASTMRSRPRILQENEGTTIVRTGTTVVTRSAKRRESPVLVPQPQPDAIEFVPSEHPFASEKFPTTYRPNRLVRYYKNSNNKSSENENEN